MNSATTNILMMNTVTMNILTMNNVAINIFAIKNVLPCSEYVADFHGATSAIEHVEKIKHVTTFQYMAHFHGSTSTLEHMGEIKPHQITSLYAFKVPR